MVQAFVLVGPQGAVRVGGQAEDVGDVRGEVVGCVEKAASAAKKILGSARGAEPEEPVLCELDIGGQGGSAGLLVERGQHRRNRACRCRDAGALRAVGEEVGVALVQAGDRLAQPLGGEDLGSPASPMWIDLDQNDLVELVGT